MDKIKILVACHKEAEVPNNDVYTPIQVGRALSKVDLGFIGDDTGDNISELNPYFCELTAQYWAWKNLKDVEYIGLCHYRRYFDFHSQCKWPLSIEAFKIKDFGRMDLSIPTDIVQEVKNGSIVIPKPYVYPVPLIYDYSFCHYSKDIKTIETIIRERVDKKYSEAFNFIMYRNGKLSHFNMFLMNWNDFDAYCSWLFLILKEAKTLINISEYGPIQCRIYGYIAERLLNVWLYAERKSIIKKPIIWINDEACNLSRLHTIIGNVRRTICYKLFAL